VVSLESIGYDVIQAEGDVGVDISRQDVLTVTVRAINYRYIIDADNDEIVPEPLGDGGVRAPLNRCPEWLSAVLQHVGIEREVGRKCQSSANSSVEASSSSSRYAIPSSVMPNSPLSTRRRRPYSTSSRHR
jgi:hypothetical protein